MTFAEMKTLLRLNLDDLNADIFDSEKCRILLNAGFRKVCNQLFGLDVGYKNETVTLSFVSGTQEVALPTNFVRLSTVIDSDQRPVPIYDAEYSLLSEIPSVYLSNNNLGWYRIPTDNFTLTINYMTTTTQFNANIVGTTAETTAVITDVPEQYHDVVVVWATLLALGKDEASQNYWGGIYDKLVSDLVDSSGQVTFKNQQVIDVYASN